MDLGGLGDPPSVESYPNHRPAAVLVPLIETDDSLELVFTKRAEGLSEHPGEMSFPGGGCEPSDPNRRWTALREADEEIGLSPDEVELVGRTTEVCTSSRYVISPFVGLIPDRPYAAHEPEVDRIVRLPVDAFLEPGSFRRQYERLESGTKRLEPSFEVDGAYIWGATGRVVVSLLEATTDWRADQVASTVE